jgi:hypothetical protein
MNYYKSDIDEVGRFLNNYSVLQVVKCSEYNKKSYLEDATENCRYCGKSRDATLFRTDAHAIPAFLGNRFLLSKDECDECNKLFKDYDDSLSKFLGFYRTAPISKGRRVPKFKDDKSGVSAFVDTDNTLNIILPRLDDIENATQTSEVKLVVNNQPYIPIHVFKCLMKMAIAIMPKEVLPKLDLAIKFIQNEVTLNDLPKVEFLKCAMDFIPAPMLVNSPIAIVYKRKNPEGLLPEFVFKLCYKQLTMQILVPFSTGDNHLYKNKHKGVILFAPNLIPFEVIRQFGSPQRKIVNFNSMEKSVSNEMTVMFKFDKLEKKKDT